VSEVFDHTSVIQLIEKRFNILCPTISPWRRVVAGDLTSAFDFDHPDYSWPDLPKTKNYTEESIDQCLHLPYPMVPTQQSLPKQESGVRISRALPYQITTSDTVDVSNKKLLLTMNNMGTAGVHLISYDLKTLGVDEAIKHFTLEPQTSIEFSPLPLQCNDMETPQEQSCDYKFQVFGPNGYFRHFSGSTQCSLHQSSLSYSPEEQTISIFITNDSPEEKEFSIIDNAYGTSALSVTLSGKQERYEVKWDVSTSSNWYDLTVSQSDCYQRRFGGRMETGVDTISDPAMGAGIPLDVTSAKIHPEIPKEYQILSRTDQDARQQKEGEVDHKDAMIYWEVEVDEKFLV
jgi:phospholipase C